MKQVKPFAIAAIAVIALASCQKMSTFTGDDLMMDVKSTPSSQTKKMSTPQEPQILNVFFSCVPAHEEEGIFKDGKGPQAPSKCFLVKYNNGYKVVVFDGKVIFPSAEQLEKAPFENIEDMSEEYNSAYYDGEAWLPAFAEDVYTEGEFVALRYTSSAPIPRTVRKETLLEWKKAGIWQQEFTTRLDGYTVTVKDGYVQVSCGEATLILE